MLQQPIENGFDAFENWTDLHAREYRDSFERETIGQLLPGYPQWHFIPHQVLHRFVILSLWAYQDDQGDHIQVWVAQIWPRSQD